MLGPWTSQFELGLSTRVVRYTMNVQRIREPWIGSKTFVYKPRVFAAAQVENIDALMDYPLRQGYTPFQIKLINQSPTFILSIKYVESSRARMQQQQKIQLNAEWKIHLRIWPEETISLQLYRSSLVDWKKDVNYGFLIKRLFLAD